MAIIFTDKNARTVLLRARRRGAAHEDTRGRDGEATNPTGEDLVLALLSKVPASEFIRTPVRIADE